MANQRIDIERTQHGSSLLTAIDQMREAKDRLAHTRSVMEASIDGTDYTKLEEVFGIPEGSGAAAYALVTGAESKIDAADIKTIIARMG